MKCFIGQKQPLKRHKFMLNRLWNIHKFTFCERFWLKNIEIIIRRDFYVFENAKSCVLVNRKFKLFLRFPRHHCFFRPNVTSYQFTQRISCKQNFPSKILKKGSTFYRLCESVDVISRLLSLSSSFYYVA